METISVQSFISECRAKLDDVERRIGYQTTHYDFCVTTMREDLTYDVATLYPTDGVAYGFVKDAIDVANKYNVRFILSSIFNKKTGSRIPSIDFIFTR